MGVNLFLSIKKSLLVSGFLLGVLSISACSDLPPEEIVKERAQARLDELVINGSVAGALAYTTPQYQKMTTPERYHTRVQGAGMWTEAVVEQVGCEEDICNVKVIVTYQVPRTKTYNTTRLDERWIRIDNQWWLYQ